jgi:hypothetical protein
MRLWTAFSWLLCGLSACGGITQIESSGGGEGPICESTDPSCACPVPEEGSDCDSSQNDCVYEVEAACGTATVRASCDIMFLV